LERFPGLSKDKAGNSVTLAPTDQTGFRDNLSQNKRFILASFLRENIKISLVSIRGQLTRTIITAAIISLGITSLVGTLAAIDSIKGSINSNFTSMGANTFTIRNKETTIRIGRSGKRPRKFREINYREAEAFVDNFRFPATASISTLATFSATMKYRSVKTNPNIQIFGVDENYISTSGYEIDLGRNFSIQEVQLGTHSIILGKDLVPTLFKNREDPINKIISVGNGKYRVIGVLKSKGNSSGFGGDKVCLLPLSNVRQYFPRPNMSYTINVLAPDQTVIETALTEASGTFRLVRKLKTGEEDNFEITRSDNLANMLIDNIKYVTIAATLIGIITLLGAAIALMNIMLVSVTERTREIGIRKSMGATKPMIRSQFLVEAIVICQMGGALGILMGIGCGFFVSLAFGGGFIIPWFWIITGILICLVVGIAAGIYPAMKAAQLDPIEALRYE
jgi:putative ABC transport system permease protein